jgi:beta-lactamase class C
MARMAGVVAKMKWLARLSIAAAVLGLVSWWGYNSDIAVRWLSLNTGDGLPASEWEWRGRIDYHILDQQLTQMATRPEMAGLAVAVVEDGELRFVHSYGFADRSNGTPVTLQTVFRWALLSKTATGTLAAKLATEKGLDLNRPIASWPNSLRLPGGAEARLSLAQLLSHQTGLPKNAYDEKLEAGEAPHMLRGQMGGVALKCNPGSCHSYQNIAFDAASEILGAAAGQPFDQAVMAQLFRPLDMTSANYGMNGLMESKDWARPHNENGVKPLREAYWRVPTASGVNSNILDLAKWMQAAMGDRAEVLPLKTVQQAHSPQVKTDDLYSGALSAALSNPHYGLGWRSFTYGKHRLIGHSGSVSGYRATMIFEPATKTGVVAMWNSDWGIPFRIPFAVLDSYHKRKSSRWLDVRNVPLPTAASVKGSQRR